LPNTIQSPAANAAYEGYPLLLFYLSPTGQASRNMARFLSATNGENVLESVFACNSGKDRFRSRTLRNRWLTSLFYYSIKVIIWQYVNGNCLRIFKHSFVKYRFRHFAAFFPFFSS